ncbi:MAG: endopeptidase La [Acidobacteriota bacterium]
MKELSASPPGAPNLEVVPLITLRDMVVFPHSIRPFIVGRPNSIAAVEAALASDRRVFLSLQQDPQAEEPSSAGLHRMGVLAQVVQSLSLPSGHLKVLVEGLSRGFAKDFLLDEEVPHASVEAVLDPSPVEVETEALAFEVSRSFDEFVRKQQGFYGSVSASSLNPEDPGRFCDQVASYLSIQTALKQKILETVPMLDRLKLVKRLLGSEIEQAHLDQRLNKEVEKQIEKTQKEYYLNEKMKLIKKELGREDSTNEIEELRERIEKAGMTDLAKEKAISELKRLEIMPPVSAEATVSRSYIDWLLALPWSKASKDNTDIHRARKILDEDHHGLEKVKERILEFLSVRQLAKEHKGSILCFVGPPGVGKTSVARSIARSMGREFVRLSLGGVHDEAEIKGHRRTYIGAFPGQIIQLMKRAGTQNPVFLLDEVDKLGADYRGDPSSALLEVLDPEQNNTFVDHYVDVPFDLSKVFFITTANVTHTIPPALLDRMEVISFSGYTLPEKLSIAKGYLIPKQRKSHGLKGRDLEFTDDGLSFIIDGYTREAGVRNLEREIASVCRKVAHKVVKEHRRAHEVISSAKAEEYLGVARFKTRKVLPGDEVGISVGLAWTQNGGDILLVESSLMQGKGELILTGQLGEVMQESARAALSFIRGQSEHFGLARDFYSNHDVHIHVPEGAIPKDGPSAGIALGVAMISTFTGMPVRHDVAMTGEITLRGKVLPVGGLKEKILAAKQHDITEVILPRDNEKDVSEVPESLRQGMAFHFVESLEEVIGHAFRKDPYRSHPSLLLEKPDAAQPEKRP